MSVFTPQGKALHLGERAGAGGEATVYRVMGQPDRLAKIYEPGPRPGYPAKLAWMLEHPPENPTSALQHASLAWPASLLYNTPKPADDHLVGYIMPFVRGSIPIISLFNPRLRAKTLPQFDWRYLHRAARNLAAALGALHSRGYVIGDLNESNILVTPSALVTLIDTDSFQVQEESDHQNVVHYCPVGKLEYTPPELQGIALDQVLRLPEHDAFGLGVLIFQLLMEGNHPFRAQWLAKGEPPPLETRIAQGAFPYVAATNAPIKPPANAPDLNSLHPRLAELVRRCFADGHTHPSQRPTPFDWELAIAEAEKSLVACERGHIYSNHLPGCPQCQRGASHTGTSQWVGHTQGGNPGAGQARGVHRSSPTVGAPRPAGGAAPAATRPAPTGWAAPVSARPAPAPSRTASPPPTAQTRSPVQPQPGPASTPPGGAQTAQARPAGAKPAGGQAGATKPAGPPPPSGQPAAGAAPYPQPVPLQTRMQQMAWEWAKHQAKNYVRRKMGLPPVPFTGLPIPNTGSPWMHGTPGPNPTKPAQTSSGPTQPTTTPASAGQPSAAPTTGSTAPQSGAAAPGQAAPGTGKPAAYAPGAPGVSGTPATGAPVPGTPASGPAVRPASATRPTGSSSGGFPRPAWSTVPSTATPHSGSYPAPGSSPNPGVTMPRRSSSRPFPAPARPGGFLYRYTARPRFDKIFLRSVGYGSGVGILSGLVPAALVAIIISLLYPGSASVLLSGFLTQEQIWALLVAVGGAVGGAVRGWQPGSQLSEMITFSIGWRRALQGAGIVAGAALGALLTLPLIWAILPIFIGLFLGGMLGLSGGRKVWEWGLRVGWDRISVVLTSLFAALWGASIARWLALTAAGAQVSQWSLALSGWVTGQTATPLLAAAATGLLAGALGGAIGGFLVDLSARIFRLTE